MEKLLNSISGQTLVMKMELSIGYMFASVVFRVEYYFGLRSRMQTFWNGFEDSNLFCSLDGDWKARQHRVWAGWTNSAQFWLHLFQIKMSVVCFSPVITANILDASTLWAGKQPVLRKHQYSPASSCCLAKKFWTEKKVLTQCKKKNTSSKSDSEPTLKPD